jgi:hypothetical protein
VSRELEEFTEFVAARTVALASDGVVADRKRQRRRRGSVAGRICGAVSALETRSTSPRPGSYVRRIGQGTIETSFVGIQPQNVGPYPTN